MPEIVSSCPLCNSPASQLFDQRPFRPAETPAAVGCTALLVVNRLCLACGFVYQSPRMTEAEQAAFYAGEYRRLYQGQETPTPKDLAVQKRRAELTAAWCRPYLQNSNPPYPIRTHLDIGCSAGVLLQTFQTVYATKPTGVEPGDMYRAYAQSLGIPIYPSLESLPAGTEENLISLMHVLEHLSHPVEYLCDLRQKYLSPNGWLLIEVPNLYAHDCFEPAHLTSFSPHTLRQALTRAGYRILAFKAHGMPRSQLIPLYLTILARPDPTAALHYSPLATCHFPLFGVGAEHFVRWRRRWGFFHRRVVTRLFPSRAWIPPQAS